MTVLSTPTQIERARLLTLRAMVRLEVLGMTRRGRPASAIAAEMLGLRKGTAKKTVLAQLDAYVEGTKQFRVIQLLETGEEAFAFQGTEKECVAWVIDNQDNYPESRFMYEAV